MRLSFVYVLSLWLLASGCATTQNKPVTTDESRYRSSTVVWGNAGRGGAAERVPGYVHALARAPRFRDGSASISVPAAAPAAAPSTKPSPIAKLPTALGVGSMEDVLSRAIAVASENTDSSTVSSPTRSPAVAASPPVLVAQADPLRKAWEKYCRGGEGMTQEEWRLINEAGAPANVPKDLSEGCVAPK